MPLRETSVAIMLGVLGFIWIICQPFYYRARRFGEYSLAEYEAVLRRSRKQFPLETLLHRVKYAIYTGYSIVTIGLLYPLFTINALRNEVGINALMMIGAASIMLVWLERIGTFVYFIMAQWQARKLSPSARSAWRNTPKIAGQRGIQLLYARTVLYSAPHVFMIYLAWALFEHNIFGADAQFNMMSPVSVPFGALTFIMIVLSATFSALLGFLGSIYIVPDEALQAVKEARVVAEPAKKEAAAADSSKSVPPQEPAGTSRVPLGINGHRTTLTSAQRSGPIDDDEGIDIIDGDQDE